MRRVVTERKCKRYEETYRQANLDPLLQTRIFEFLNLILGCVLVCTKYDLKEKEIIH